MRIDTLQLPDWSIFFIGAGIFILILIWWCIESVLGCLTCAPCRNCYKRICQLFYLLCCCCLCDTAPKYEGLKWRSNRAKTFFLKTLFYSKSSKTIPVPRITIAQPTIQSNEHTHRRIESRVRDRGTTRAIVLACDSKRFRVHLSPPNQQWSLGGHRQASLSGTH